MNRSPFSNYICEHIWELTQAYLEERDLKEDFRRFALSKYRELATLQ